MATVQQTPDTPPYATQLHEGYAAAIAYDPRAQAITEARVFVLDRAQQAAAERPVTR